MEPREPPPCTRADSGPDVGQLPAASRGPSQDGHARHRPDGPGSVTDPTAGAGRLVQPGAERRAAAEARDPGAPVSSSSAVREPARA